MSTRLGDFFPIVCMTICILICNKDNIIHGISGGWSFQGHYGNAFSSKEPTHFIERRDPRTPIAEDCSRSSIRGQ